MNWPGWRISSGTSWEKEVEEHVVIHDLLHEDRLLAPARAEGRLEDDLDVEEGAGRGPSWARWSPFSQKST